MLLKIFPKWTNYLPTVAALGLVGGGTVVVTIIGLFFGPSHTDVGYAPKQPIHYSHKIHAGNLGMDCRYCHTAVEIGPHANVPSTQVCMNCHGWQGPDSKGIRWNGVEADGTPKPGTSPEIAKLHEAHDNGKPVEWEKVHLLPDYAYFNHSVHLNIALDEYEGGLAVGCIECHGRIDQMEVVRQVEPLSMGWCLECHRNPAPNLRPKAEATNMRWNELTSQADQNEVVQAAQKLVDSGAIAPPEHCSACHH